MKTEQDELIAVPRKLLERMRESRRKAKKRHRKASAWTGEYGYGAGRAHPSVEFVACPHCQSPAGKLCTGPHGPKLGHHYRRSRQYRELKRRAAEQLDTRVGVSEVGGGRSK